MSNEIKEPNNIDIEKINEALQDMAQKIGNALKPVMEAFQRLADELYITTEEQAKIEINNIRNNPSLKLLQRYRLIRNIKREARKQGIHL